MKEKGEWRRCQRNGCATMYQGDTTPLRDTNDTEVEVNLCNYHEEEDLWWDGESAMPYE